MRRPAAVVENLLSKEDLVSMDRGCVCCSLRNDIVKALKELQGRGAARGAAPYDCILLETTGLADPAPVAFTFFANSWISANYRLDSILCLVDAQHLRHVRFGGGVVVGVSIREGGSHAQPEVSSSNAVPAWRLLPWCRCKGCLLGLLTPVHRCLHPNPCPRTCPRSTSRTPGRAT